MSTESLGGVEFPHDERAGAAESAHLGELLRALQAVRDGDFSVRLPGDRVGLEGKIADTFNEIVRSSAGMADELERVGEAVGREGRTCERVRFAQAIGAWGDMEASVNTLIDGLVWPTAEVTRGRVKVWTLSVAARPAGAPAEQAVTREAFLASVHPEDRAVVDAALGAALSGGAGFAAEFRVGEAGRERFMLGRGTVLRDASGQPVSIAGMSMDITARKRAEQERGRLLVEAQQARRQAEEANRLKDEFLATLSHELRTPLHAILGWAHLLRLGALDEAQHERAVETISRNAELQNQLIADILDVSRIVAGKLRLETRPVDLRAVVEAALDTVRPAADAKRIAITSDLGDEPGPVLGDAARLQQVVWNVLANAIKFTPPGGHMELEVARRGERLDITVRDDGPGIPAEFLPHVFDRFRQADSSSTRPHQGLGLGLAIVRHLVEMHGGTVAADNRRDRLGAVVTISLPRPSATESLTPPPDLAGADGGRPPPVRRASAVARARWRADPRRRCG